MDSWLVMVAQLPTEDPAARMRVLRTLESLGAGVLREGAYALPDSAANREALEALADYTGKCGGSAHVLRAATATPEQNEAFKRLFDRSARYEELVKTVESLRIGFGHSDPSAIARVLLKQRRDFEAISALDFFPTPAKVRAQKAIAVGFDGAHFAKSELRVTYEEIVAQLQLGANAALKRIGSIVHCLESRGTPVPEAAGVEMMLQGAQRRAQSEDEL